mmetsp:Transcript_62370/g.148572  ORF Transcript_62370/g.148572 Transcript_62370/m.148572 type:complete len:140 (-) Transcript_62370:383-802(-)
MDTKEVNDAITAQFNMRREASVSKDMAKLDEVCDKFWVEGWQIVRPSGNPLTYESQKEMFLSPDVKFISSELVGINSTKIFANGAAAVVVYTTHDKFEYKGTANDDIAVFSATLEKTDAGWKFVHLHRATGKKPESTSG